jgi:signal transduction histidine kinase
MSAHSYSPLPENRELLGELLHSVSQPLTTLRCSLELSLDEAADQQQHTITTALEQTEDVIALIRLMREYLDAEHGEAEGPAIALMPVLTSVSDDLSPWAALREVRIRMMGTCSAELSIKASGLRRALEYLLSAMIERQAAGSEITFRMSENPSEALVRIEGERGLGNQPNSNRTRDSVGSTMRRVRLAIAARVLESAGVTLACDDDVPGLVLRLPHVGGPSV